MDTYLFDFDGALVKSNRIIYTPSAFAKTNLIYLQETGALHAQKPHICKRSHLHSYLFFVVLHGSGTLEYNETVYHLSKNDCVFLDCQNAYSHHSSSNLWTLKWVHFSGCNMNRIYEKYTERGGLPCFRSYQVELYDQILTQLYEIAASSVHVRDMRIYEKLTALLTLLMEQSWNPEIVQSNTWRKRNLQNVKKYLDLHYMEKITLDKLSEIFYINKFYLTRIFKEQFGITVAKYIVQIRITHAKQLLRFTDLPIEKISHECGMNDANYFSRVFKKIEGVSPGEFRKLW